MNEGSEEEGVSGLRAECAFVKKVAEDAEGEDQDGEEITAIS